MPLPTIEPREFFVKQTRAFQSPTVYFGPFTEGEAIRFCEKHGFGQIIGMIHPEDAVNENGELRQEVWY